MRQLFFVVRFSNAFALDNCDGLGEINDLTSHQEWRWVSAKLNPADCITRGTCKIEAAKKLWFKGPEFLIEPERNWLQPKNYWIFFG